MYNQRRGLASGQVQSDVDTRNSNADLMRGRRRQQLLNQLQEKEDLLKQYTNPRGIGMGGQTVPKRDVDILRQQIDNLRVQLEGGNDAITSSVPPSSHGSLPGSSDGGGGGSQYSGAAPPTQFQGGGGYQPPSSRHSQQSTISMTPQQQPTPSAYPSMKTPSSSGQSTRRDEVWHRKYQQWLDRQNGAESQHRGGGGGYSQDTPVSSHAGQMPWEQASPPQSSRQEQQQPAYNNHNEQQRAPAYEQNAPTYAQPPLAPTNGARSNSGVASNNANLAFAQQQQVQYGRRATPPTHELLNQQQRQQQSSANNNSRFSNAGNDVIGGGTPIQNNNYRRGGQPTSSQGVVPPTQQQQQPPQSQGRARGHQHTSLW